MGGGVMPGWGEGTLAEPVILPGAAVGIRLGLGCGVGDPGMGAGVVGGGQEGTRQQVSSGLVTKVHVAGTVS